MRPFFFTDTFLISSTDIREFSMCMVRSKYPSLMRMALGRTLLACTAFFMSVPVMPVNSRFRFLGVICISFLMSPLISTIATSGSCSMRRLMTFSHNSLIRTNSSVFVGSKGRSLFRVSVTYSTGISVLLTLSICGLSKLAGRFSVTLPIFSFISTSAMSISVL